MADNVTLTSWQHEQTSGGHDKFYRAYETADAVITHWGRNGSAGQARKETTHNPRYRSYEIRDHRAGRGYRPVLDNLTVTLDADTHRRLRELEGGTKLDSALRDALDDAFNRAAAGHLGALATELAAETSTWGRPGERIVALGGYTSEPGRHRWLEDLVGALAGRVVTCATSGVALACVGIDAADKLRMTWPNGLVVGPASAAGDNPEVAQMALSLWEDRNCLGGHNQYSSALTESLAFAVDSARLLTR